MDRLCKSNTVGESEVEQELAQYNSVCVLKKRVVCNAVLRVLVLW